MDQLDRANSLKRQSLTIKNGYTQCRRYCVEVVRAFAHNRAISCSVTARLN